MAGPAAAAAPDPPRRPPPAPCPGGLLTETHRPLRLEAPRLFVPEPVLTPVVQRRPLKLFEDTWLVLDAPAISTAPLAEEAVLRQLLELDPAEPYDVKSFLNAHGLIWRAYDNPQTVPAADRRAMYQRDPLGFHVLHAAWWLRAARALTGHWLAWAQGGDVGAVWEAEGFRFTRAGEDELAWQFFVDRLNVGLRPLQAHVERRFPHGSVQGAPSPDLYEGLCIQLAALLREEPTLRRCANETCSRFSSARWAGRSGVSIGRSG